MWRYEKRLQYPVKISQPNAKMAQFIISQYGGPEVSTGQYKILIFWRDLYHEIC